MTYRIQVGGGEKKGQWVRPFPDGSFEYVSLSTATIFCSQQDAELALASRDRVRTVRRVCGPEYASDFKIVPDFGTFGTKGASRETAPQQAFLFIGGPKDGTKLVLQDASPTYAFPVAPRLQLGGVYAYPSPSTIVNVGRAVYLRHKLGVNPTNGQPAQRYTVYVFSHIEGLVPTDPGQTILFEGRQWVIESLSWMPTGARFQARARAEFGYMARISGSILDLYYEWNLDAWAFKSKSVVEVDETRTVVVA